MTSKKDFYLDQKGLASYFEKEWFDYYLKSTSKIVFDFTPFDTQLFYSKFNENVAKTVLKHINELNCVIETYLEIGPGLGRTFYEIARGASSLKQATLVEPSENLTTSLHKLFVDGAVQSFPFLSGLDALSEIRFDCSPIKETCLRIKKRILSKSFSEVWEEVSPTELVICLNVLDQCQDPFELLELVKKKTVKDGILVVSCTFQWQKKYLGSDATPFTDLRSQFTAGWTLLSEMNVPFHVKLNERCWYNFLPQVLILRKASA